MLNPYRRGSGGKQEGTGKYYQARRSRHLVTELRRGAPDWCATCRHGSVEVLSASVKPIDAGAADAMVSVDIRQLLSDKQRPAYVRQPICCGLDASLIGGATYCYQTIAIGERSRKRTIAELYDS
jgi:hypothetical protein